jgi:hypothetical protein
MARVEHNRREFLKTTGIGAAAAGMTAYFFTSSSQAQESKNDRLVAGAIGLGGMGRGDAGSIARFADMVAVCDVDRRHAEQAAAHERIGKGKADVYEDYRELLARRHRPRDDQHARPLAREDLHRRDARRQAHLLPEAADAHD